MNLGWAAAESFAARCARAAAQAQHGAAAATRDFLANNGLTVADLARALRCGPAELDGKLAGRAWAAPADLTAWALRSGANLGALTGDAVAAARLPTGPATNGASQRRDGRFLTRTNPFFHPAFIEWFSRLGPRPRLCEPFAGARGIPAMLEEVGLDGQWECWDVTPLHPAVERRDTLADFPDGCDAVVTNPPYLARHFARRKGIAVDGLPWDGFANLYQVALSRCLNGTEFVAAIVPESFVTSGLFTDRLGAVVSLTAEMFTDTTTPTCLALWGPEPTTGFWVWRGPRRLGRYHDLAVALPETPEESRIQFNNPHGQVGLRAVDPAAGPGIAFVPPEDIPSSRVNHASRLVTRILVAGLDRGDAPAVRQEANRKLEVWRDTTGDVLLTAFKGLRADGSFRRRLDFAAARRLLAASVASVEAGQPNAAR